MAGWKDVCRDGWMLAWLFGYVSIYFGWWVDGQVDGMWMGGLSGCSDGWMGIWVGG